MPTLNLPTIQITNMTPELGQAMSQLFIHQQAVTVQQARLALTEARVAMILLKYLCDKEKSFFDEQEWEDVNLFFIRFSTAWHQFESIHHLLSTRQFELLHDDCRQVCVLANRYAEQAKSLEEVFTWIVENGAHSYWNWIEIGFVI